MLLFRSEAGIDQWCAERNQHRGAVISLEQTWALSLAWYSSRLRPDFHGHSPAAAEAIFRSVGLDGPFWSFHAP